MSNVKKYIFNLLETLEPNLDERQMRIRSEPNVMLWHDDITQSVWQELRSIR